MSGFTAGVDAVDGPGARVELDNAVRVDPYTAYLDSLGSAESRRTMRGCLDRVAQLLSGLDDATGAGQPWHLLRYEHTSRLRAVMVDQGWSGSYINKHLAALRRVLKEAWRLELMEASDYQRACDVAPIREHRLPVGRAVDKEVLAGALYACDRDDTPAGARDGAVLAVLYSTGARRSEVASMRFVDVDASERSIRILGKGNKERQVYLAAGAMSRLDRWLAVRARVSGALFCPVNKAGRFRYRQNRLAHMSGQAVSDLVLKRLLEAGEGRYTPHDFRRTFIGDLLDSGVDLAITQSLVGHASPATTARYDRRPSRRRRDAVDRLQVPET